MPSNALKTYMLANRSNEREGGRENRVDNRFRDRTGREHYDDGRFAPMRSEYGRDNGGMQMGYGGYSEGPGMNYARYSPERSEGDNMRMGYGQGERMGYNRYSPESRRGSDNMRMGYVEPILMGGDEDEEYRRKWTITEANGGRYMEPRYETEYNRDGMRRVMGFGGSSYVEHPRMDEMSHRSGEKMPGYASTKGAPKMTREMAEEWMENLQNEYGTRGPHWSLEQVKELMNKKGIECDPVRLWVAMNAEYSDSVMINRKHGVDNAEFYLDSAIARWLQDKDAVKDKEAAYFMYVVKH